MKQSSHDVGRQDEPLPNTLRFVTFLGIVIFIGWIAMAIFVWRSW